MRAWMPRTCWAANGGQREPQYITAHCVNPREFEEIRSLAGKQEIVRDHEIQLRRADGSTIWCSTNCRRGLYHGRPSLVIGVLDITERKQREDLFGFLIKHHPLPVWMSDAGTGEVIYQSDAAEAAVRLGRRKRRTRSRIGSPISSSTASNILEIGRELHPQRRRRELRGSAQGCRRPRILGERQSEGRRVPGPTGGAGRHRRRDQAEEARRRESHWRARCSPTPSNRCRRDLRSTTRSTDW